MAIYELQHDTLVQLSPRSLPQTGQGPHATSRRLLRDYIDAVAPGSLVVSTEYFPSDRHGHGVLAIDHHANLVLVQFKMDHVGAHMELQALRLATMASSLSFARVAAMFGEYLRSIGNDTEPTSALLGFLGWDEPNEHRFGQDVRIVIVSGEFSADVASAVVWLNEHGLDIRCVRFDSYLFSGRVLLEIRQILPVPETPDFRNQLVARETAARTTDLTRYNVKLGPTEHEKLASRWAIWHVIKDLVDAGVAPCLRQVVLKSSIVVKDGKYVAR